MKRGGREGAIWHEISMHARMRINKMNAAAAMMGMMGRRADPRGLQGMKELLPSSFMEVLSQI